MPNSQKPPKAEERKVDWELTSVSHGSHDDSHDSHDSLARSLSRPRAFPRLQVRLQKIWKEMLKKC